MSVFTSPQSCAHPCSREFSREVMANARETPEVFPHEVSFSKKPTFSVTHQQGKARCGVIHTAHGSIPTPGFFFCATQGALKAVDNLTLLHHQVPALLCNTYHLMVQPGVELIENMGGLHQFMSWPRPIFTDSGGYQIFSLRYGSVSAEIKGRRQPPSCKGRQNVAQGFASGAPKKSLVKVTKEGATFRSHRDGTLFALNPEMSIKIQCALGVDLMCMLDECTPLHISRQRTQSSMYLSHSWALRSLEAFTAFGQPHQGLYGIVQGGVYPDLRHESIDFITQQPFFGHAIGGSLGETKEDMRKVVRDVMCDERMQRRPIHLLGIGGVVDIFAGVLMGIDTFDCVSPTRLGRHGCALVQPHYWQDAKEPPHSREHINLSRSYFRQDDRPIDTQCPCATCTTYSRAYLHHLLRAKEMTALSAITLHNVVFMTRFMEAIRQGITSCALQNVASQWLMPQGRESIAYLGL